MALDFEGVLATFKRNREQKTIEEEELESNECPYCMVRLKVNEKGEKACPMCKRIWN